MEKPMLSRSAFLCFLIIASVCPILARPASATTAVRMSLGERAQSSSTVVHGAVLSTSSRWNADRTMIVTDVRVRVLDAIKGGPGGEITVTQPGGQIGKLRTDVAGATAFLPGEEAVLFLVPGPDGDLYLNGLAGGRLEVTEDPRTGAKTVRGVPREAMGALGGPGVLPGAAGPEGGSLPLGMFLDGMRRLVRDLPTDGGR
jgi:hypothetical protein